MVFPVSEQGSLDKGSKRERGWDGMGWDGSHEFTPAQPHNNRDDLRVAMNRFMPLSLPIFSDLDLLMPTHWKSICEMPINI